MKEIIAADLFCGAGGTSTGLYQAATKLGYKVNLLAVNHWPVAIATHSSNHKFAQHLCHGLDGVNPRDLFPGGHIDLLMASPECTHHSLARGSRPKEDQSRASAWHICRWAEALNIESILIENVKEFRDWGPLDSAGKSIKTRKGETYRAFLNALRSLGYSIEDRVINAADNGDPTTRRRLYIIAKKEGKRISWPTPTHSEDGAKGTKKWVAAREIIDWTLPSKSIFGRKKDLAPKTINRILAGLQRHGGPDLQPFLVMLYGTGVGRDIKRPLPTVTGSGQHIGLCEPFVIGQHGGAAPRSAKKPLPTIATKGAISLVQPFLVPFFGERKGQDPRTHSVDNPLPAVTSHGAGGLVEPCLIPVNHGQKSKGENRSRSVDKVMPCLTAKNGWGLVSAAIVQYNGTSLAHSVDKPLGTLTGHDRFGLVTVDGKDYVLDINFRMLQPHELAAAMSFPKDYKFSGTKCDTVKQIGNAVAVKTAQALCEAVLGD